MKEKKMRRGECGKDVFFVEIKWFLLRFLGEFYVLEATFI